MSKYVSSNITERYFRQQKQQSWLTQWDKNNLTISREIPMNRAARRYAAKQDGEKLSESLYYLPKLTPLVKAGVDIKTQRQLYKRL